MEISADQVSEILPYVLVGFAAQLIDGALGMAFGVICTTLLVSRGVDPAIASAGVHFIKVFTGGVAGISHVVHRNVNWRLFRRIVVPGVIGGVIGAYVLTQISAATARPFVLAYLAAIGAYLLWKAIRHRQRHRNPRVVEPLGFAGGFLDAAGGGGWGPIVTSNLLVQGAHPRKVIGTVNTAEFFLAVAISAAFVVSLRAEALTIPMAGLLIGGLAAAPLGGPAAKWIPARPLLALVAAVLIATSLFGIWSAIA